MVEKVVFKLKRENMKNFILLLFIKAKLFPKRVLSILRTLSFCYFSFKWKIFGSGDPLNILRILKLYLSYECSEYSDKYIMSRDKYTSAGLFTSLVDKYIETQSIVTLNQLLSVLKEEFIERDNNGRK